MYIALFSLAGLMFLLGMTYMSAAETVFQEYIAVAAFLGSIIFLCGGAIVQAVGKVAWLLEDEEEEEPPPRKRR